MAPSSCPQCHSEMVRRSQRSAFERVVGFLPLRPFRCRHCRYRFWRLAPPSVSIPAAVGLTLALLAGLWVAREVYRVTSEEHRLARLGREALEHPRPRVDYGATGTSAGSSGGEGSAQPPPVSLSAYLDGPAAANPREEELGRGSLEDRTDDPALSALSAPAFQALELVDGGRGVAVLLRADGRVPRAQSVADGRGLFLPGNWSGVKVTELRLEHPLAESLRVERKVSGLEVVFSPRPDGADLALAEAEPSPGGVIVRLRPYP